MTSDYQPAGPVQPSAPEELLRERDALRDEVEGLRAAVDTVMRALKIALKEHNEARVREAVLIDLLRQSEAEGSSARALLRRCQTCLAADSADAALLLQEIEVSLVDSEEEEES
jgi:hypothetical protein